MPARARPDPARDTPAPQAFVAPLFLGAGGENAPVFERLLLDFVRDHLYWRRNFHPEDPPTITSAEQHRPDFVAAISRTEQALRDLSARLKRSVPLYSPRYVGHMASDLLLPGLLAQLVTTLYNPNNVSVEVAPVTLDFEIEAGHRLARMLGFAAAPDAAHGAYGHLTSGGTLANYEALWLHRAIRCYPLAVAQALGDLPAVAAALGAARGDPWRLANLGLERTLALHDAVEAALARRKNAAARRRALADVRYERLGLPAFLARHGLATPVVIAPRTAHYSWPKAMQLLGLGDAQLWPADVDAHMRIAPRSVDALLDRARRERIPVLAVVAVLGTTEFGTIDPVHELVALRARCARRGQAFALHVDAAWGGYLASMFRRADGRAVARTALRRRFRYFPSPAVYRAFGALGAADSVTVDPHKLGYLPFGAGAFVGRDRRMTGFVGQRPVYLYDQAAPLATRERLAHLGDYILEGSKPGAAAAALHVAHHVVPLDADHFGRLAAQTVAACERLYDRLRASARRLAPRCRLALPIEPDTNLVCLAVNPAGNRSLARMNRFGRRLYGRVAVDGGQPVQSLEFIGSHTSLLRRNLSDAAVRRIARDLRIAPASFVPDPADPGTDADHVFLLRHTLMNPWLTRGAGGHDYVERYAAFLERTIGETLAETDWR